MIRSIGRLLTNEVMGFLSLLALVTALVPFVFPLDPWLEKTLDGVEWVVIGLFVLEFSSSLSLAPDRRAFLTDPWRLLDAATILGPLASLLPMGSETFRSSIALRLLRAVRAAVFGLRFGRSLRGRAEREEGGPAGPPSVRVLREGASPEVQPATWDVVLLWSERPAGEWYHASSLDRARFAEVADASDLPPAVWERALGPTAFPRLEVVRDLTTLFLWFPLLSGEGEEFSVVRRGVLLVTRGRALLTLSASPIDLPERLLADLGRESADLPFSTRLALLLLAAVSDAFESVVGFLEREVRALEEIPVQEGRPEFFARTFRLKKELSAVQADLWRVRAMLTSIADGRSTAFAGEAVQARARLLADQADYLYETASNAREGVLSIIDLHLNVVSFQMNKVMRFLAVVSALGLIPAVVGGLFGMNLVDNPWPITLPQLTFCVASAMSFALYFFGVKGWLR